MRIRHIIPLDEARRNPEQNPKTSAHEALKRYRGQPDTFVTFVSDLGKMTHGKAPHITGTKFGINPRSTYKTPIGIYAYPVDYVLALWDRDEKVPFAWDQPYLWVFRMKPDAGVLDLASYTVEQLAEDTKRIKEYVEAHDASYDQRDAYKDAYVKTPGGRLWNVSREGARAIVRERLYQRLFDEWQAEYDKWADEQDAKPRGTYTVIDDDGEEIEVEDERDEDETFHMRQPTIYDVDEQEIGERYPKEWRKMFVHLGYQAVIDGDGQGVIHENEPTQAVFFTAAAAKPLELIRNIKPRSTPITDIEMWTRNPKLVLRLIAKKAVTERQVYDWIVASPNVLIDPAVFQALPDAVQKTIGYNISEFVRRVGVALPFETFNLSDNNQHGLIVNHVWALEKLRSVGPKTREYIIDRLMHTRLPSHLGEFFLKSPAFSDEEKLDIVGKVLSYYTATRRSAADMEDWFRMMGRVRPSMAMELVDHLPEEARVRVMLPALRALYGPKGIADFFIKEGEKRPFAWQTIMAMWTRLSPEETNEIKSRLSEIPEWVADRITRLRQP